MLIILIFLKVAPSFQQENVNISPTCDTYGGYYSKVHVNSKLTGTTVLTIRNIDRYSCSLACIQHTICKSFSVSDSTNVCLLHQYKINENGAHLTTANEWVYYENVGFQVRSYSVHCYCLTAFDLRYSTFFG